MILIFTSISSEEMSIFLYFTYSSYLYSGPYFETFLIIPKLANISRSLGQPLCVFYSDFGFIPTLMGGLLYLFYRRGNRAN